ncbi:desampylase [Haloplanus sp. GCM10025708]|uniref:desampylase n=1 Tax=Haloferacaceae TaxID=1644056 RepID=UPI00360E32AD
MTSTELVLAPGVRRRLLAHAWEGAAGDPPREVCGVLVGDDGRVTDLRRVPNVADDPHARYELDPEATIDVVDAAEAAGESVIGFYHSHPESAAAPSDTDRERATWVGYVYAIVSPRDDEVRAWRWTGEAFESLDVRVE